MFFVENHDVLELESIGLDIERDPAFPHRINVALAHVDACGLDLVMWERGRTDLGLRVWKLYRGSGGDP